MNDTFSPYTLKWIGIQKFKIDEYMIILLNYLTYKYLHNNPVLKSHI